jgi:U4/U6 small nuclear ribonucleoprotein PRP31
MTDPNATTTTLADTLLDDLDDLDEEKEQNEEELKARPQNQTDDLVGSTTVYTHADQESTFKEASSLAHKQQQQQYNPNQDTALQAHLQLLQNQSDNHNLVIPSTKVLSKLTNAVQETHLQLQQAYQLKFPELADLITDPLQYLSAVQAIWNETDVTKIDLSSILTPNQIITISVAGSTTAGRLLTEEELQELKKICQIMTQIVQIRDEITNFVQNSMNDWAPNTTALVGSEIAAQLVALAGGLEELSRIPACNLQVLGQVKSVDRAGFSNIYTQPHRGLLQRCDLVQSCSSNLQAKALKVVASKLALAIRCDFVNHQTGRQVSNQSGQALRGQVLQKIQQWQVPDKAPTLKALPKPDMTTKKRRGGKRIRRLKERFEETDLMKQANSRAFATQTGEYADDSMGLTMGLLDAAEGVVRKQVGEKRKFRHANTQASRKRQQQLAAASASKSSGLASSMVFTPVQGMELIDPSLQQERVKEANQKWFSKNAGFQSAVPKK